MESIFDIFGSHDPVKTTTINPLPLKSAVKGTLSSQGLLPGKQSIRNENYTSKEKKVLCDVGNKIKGLDKKLETKSNENNKKSSQEITNALKFACKTSFPENDCSKKSDMLENSKVSPCSLWENGCDSNDIDTWPAVETQGSSFWAEDDYDGMWSKTESPVVEDFLNVPRIWDIGTKHVGERLRPPSPLSMDLNDNFEFCLDIPETHSNDLVLEEVSVKFPWEIS